MNDERDMQNNIPETAQPEPVVNDPVEQSFADAERLAEQAEAEVQDEPCCEVKDNPKPQYQPPQYTYAAYTERAQQQPTQQEEANGYRPPRYTEQYQANNANGYSAAQNPYGAQNPNGQPQYNPNYTQPYTPPQGGKSRIAAGVLAILFGSLGIHNFYIGRIGMGVAQLAISVCSCGVLAIVSEIWGIVDGVRLLQGSIYTDGHGMRFVD